MALTYALSTWPYLSAYLQNRDVDVLYAEQLIDAATLRLEREVDNFLVQRAVTGEKHSGGPTQRVRGGGKRIFLRRYPIVSVSSIADDQDTPATVSSDDYEILSAEGILEHDYLWPVPQWRWNVSYTAGRFADTDSVTEDVRLACHMLVSHYLNQPQGPWMSETAGEKTRTFMPQTDELPGPVCDLIAPYRSVRC